MSVWLWGRSRVRRSEAVPVAAGVHCRGAGDDGAHAILSGEEVFSLVLGLKSSIAQSLPHPRAVMLQLSAPPNEARFRLQL